MSLASLQKIAAIKSRGRNCPKGDCLENSAYPSVFSSVGGIRNIPYIGKSYRFSGPTGCCSNDPSVIKKASLNTMGMLKTRYKVTTDQVTGAKTCPRFAFNTQYPYTWVKDNSDEYEAGNRITKLKRSTSQCKSANTEAVLMLGCSDPSSTKCTRLVRQGSHMVYENAGVFKNQKGAIPSSEYLYSGLMTKNCLDKGTPRHQNPFAPFPFPLSGPCATSIVTVPQAIEAGLLAPDHVNEVFE